MSEGPRACCRCGSTKVNLGPCPACALEQILLGGEPEDPTGSEAISSITGAGWGHDYQILDKLGEGGMGVVYRARQLSLGRIVALKTIRSASSAREDDRERFLQEAAAVARLRHPNVVTVFEVGEHEEGPWFAMEFVEGRSLAELARQNPFPPEQAAELVRKLAGAIHHAHEQGVLHRDLKPSNVMMDAGGEPRVLDFGLAKTNSQGSDLTQTGAVLGSPSYMPPEQAKGTQGGFDRRGDVYSLGAILYELLVGHPPFQGATPLATLRLVMDQEAIAPRQFNPSLPRDLETICLTCLAKLPERRYPTAASLEDELGRFLRDEPILARPAGWMERTGRWCRRQPRLAASLLLSFLLLGALAAVSSVAALKLHAERSRTKQAHAQAEAQLWSAYLAQARAARYGGRPGRREESLSAIRSATAIRTSAALRTEAVGALVLHDIGPELRWRAEIPAGLAYTPDLKSYAMGSADGGIQVFETDGDRPVAELDEPGGRPMALRWSHGPVRLAVLSDSGSVRVWDWTNRQSIPLPSMPPARLDSGSIALRPDGGQLCVLGRDGRLSLVQLDSPPATLGQRIGQSVSRMGYSPDSRRLAVLSEQQVEIWEVSPPRILRTLTQPGGPTTICWLGDSRRIAVGHRTGEIHIWDAELGTSVAFPGHTQHISTLAVSPQNDLLVSHGWDATSRLWDTSTGRQLLVATHGLATEFDTTGTRLAFHREEGGFGTWAFQRGEGLVTLGEWSAQVGTIEFSPDSRWLLTADHRGLSLWDPESGRRAAWVSANQAMAATFSAAGDAVLAFQGDTLLRWPVEPLTSGTPGVRFGPGTPIARDPGNHFTALRLAAGGNAIVAAGRDRSIALDLGKPARRLVFADQLPQEFLAVAPGGDWSATASFRGYGVLLWRRNVGLVHQLVTNDSAQLAFSPDGKLLATASPDALRIFNTADWKVQRSEALQIAGAYPAPVSFSPDGQMLAYSPDRREIRLTEPLTGEERLTLHSPTAGSLNQMRFSPDGRWLAVVEETRVVRCWDLRLLRTKLAGMGLDWK